MKAEKKTAKIIGYVIILALVFLCAFNITYSYFTATDQATGTLRFGNLNVRFAYGYGSGSVEVVDSDTLTVFPNASSVNIGDSFTLLLENGTDVSYLAFNSSSDSTSSYIRFRINAYKQNDGVLDLSTNYGQYFDFAGRNSSDIMRSVRTNGGETNAIYYVRSALATNSTMVFATGITLLSNAPISILNSELKITISFEAVQQANEAFRSVFNDGWGYHSSWT